MSETGDAAISALKPPEHFLSFLVVDSLYLTTVGGKVSKGVGAAGVLHRSAFGPHVGLRGL